MHFLQVCSRKYGKMKINKELVFAVSLKSCYYLSQKLIFTFNIENNEVNYFFSRLKCK